MVYQNIKPHLPARFEKQLDFYKTDVEFNSELIDLFAKSSKQFLSLADLVKLKRGEFELALKSCWTTDRLALAPGEEVLKYVYSKFGFKFCKAKDSARIASFMQVANIDAKLQEIILQLDSK